MEIECDRLEPIRSYLCFSCTTLSANLHNELMQRLELQTEPFKSDLYAVAYRVAEMDGTSQCLARTVDCW
jgi:hypothetical protein